MNLEKRIRADRQTTISDAVARQLSSLGKPRTLHVTDVKCIYDALYPDEPNPQRIEYASSTEKSFDVEKFLSVILKDDWVIFRKEVTYVIEDDLYKDTFLVIAKEPGYLLTISLNYESDDARKNTVPVTILNWKEEEEDSVWPSIEGKKAISTGFNFYYSIIDPDGLEKTKKILADAYKNSLLPNSDDASIGIISSDQGEFYVRRFSLKEKTPSFLFPDLHYGEGFTEFHESLLTRVEKDTKGLILLHGEPGTGKTQYIRILLKELARMNKSVLYAPPSLSASLTDPDMIEFISDWVIKNDKDCILLIEDAEPLLEARNGFDGRTTGISNLLNMTDGILNDILGLMVIATFNTELAKIDPALLRPQRLLARKQFKKITEDQGKKLAEAINTPFPEIKYPASLADFYTAKMDRAILIHDVDGEKRQIGFKR